MYYRKLYQNIKYQIIFESIFENYTDILIKEFDKNSKIYNCDIELNNLYYDYKSSRSRYIKNVNALTKVKNNNTIKYSFNQNILIDDTLFNIIEDTLINKYRNEDVIMFIFINILLYDFDNLKQYKIHDECLYNTSFFKCFNILCDILINDEKYKNLDYIKKASEYNIRNKTFKEFKSDLTSMFNHYICDSIFSIINII